MARKSLRSYIIGAAVAILGSAVSLASGFALFSRDAEDKTINITVGGQATAPVIDEITIATTDPVWQEGSDEKLQPNATDIFDLTATFTASADCEYKQPVLPVDMTVTITSSNENLLNYMKAAGTKVEADPDAEYYGTFWAADGQSTAEFSQAEVTQSEESSLYSMTSTKTILLEKGVDLDIRGSVTVGALSDDDFIALNGQDSSYTLTVDFSEPQNYNYAYIVSESTSFEKDIIAQRMYPNPIKGEFQWSYNMDCLDISDGQGFKAWIKSGEEIWSADMSQEEGKKNNIYGADYKGKVVSWTGFSDGQLYLDQESSDNQTLNPTIQ